MNFKNIKRKIIFFPILTLIFAGYFSYHAFSGEYSFYTIINTSNEIAKIDNKIEELLLNKALLEKEIHLLSDEHIDPDFLEEKARLLGYSYKNDKIYILSARM